MSAPTPRNTDSDQHQTSDTVGDRWENVASWLRGPARSDGGQEGERQDGTAVRREAAAPDADDERDQLTWDPAVQAA